MNRHLLDKNVGVFPQNSTFFIQILILMITLKIDVTLKSFLVMQFSIIVWINLTLNSSIRLQWLLYHQIKERRKYNQTIKFKELLIITFWTYKKWCFCSFLSKLLFRNLAAVFTRVSITMFTDMVQELQVKDIPYTYHLNEGC